MHKIICIIGLHDELIGSIKPQFLVCMRTPLLIVNLASRMWATPDQKQSKTLTLRDQYKGKIWKGLRQP
jgi:hypothetical protein